MEEGRRDSFWSHLGAYTIPSAYFTDASSYARGDNEQCGGVPSVNRPRSRWEAQPLVCQPDQLDVAHLKFDATTMMQRPRQWRIPSGTPTFIGARSQQRLALRQRRAGSSSTTFTWAFRLTFSSSRQDFSVAFWTRFTGCRETCLLAITQTRMATRGDPGSFLNRRMVIISTMRRRSGQGIGRA